MESLNDRLAGYQILKITTNKNGSFSRKKIWIRGWHPEVSEKFIHPYVKCIDGLTGNETLLIIDEISPILVFDYHTGKKN